MFPTQVFFESKQMCVLSQTKVHTEMNENRLASPAGHLEICFLGSIETQTGGRLHFFFQLFETTRMIYMHGHYQTLLMSLHCYD
jgi:hypothetical protein